ncbi:Wadjet anti-phage system protein JetD domain-containing protein [Billgrantia lactosivorans]|uniref:Wadjet anti-phage system protein JetD domain-containing protein n=1 Tax=Billgrantia lactosivorans TaxID=2185141 RepID=UPI000DADA621|nr:Wadjet anti-phage system protein JetD domain-containing protein [Halomonas lactosivorans]
MRDATLILGESARESLAWLEEEWQRVYSRAGKGKGWRSFTLIRLLQQKGICQTELHAWQVLEELGRAELIALPAGVLLSPRAKLPVKVELSVARREALMSASPALDPRLGLESGQHSVWRRAQEGPLGDWSIEDQLALADGLRRLADDLPGAYQLSPYVASARYLLGSSKLLETLPTELVRSFGIEPDSFQAAETWLLASVPEQPEGLLLIENAQSFSQACRVGCGKRLALICTFGYGLSLANALNNNEDRVQLVGQGTAGVTLADLLRLPCPTYWGDLDPEGLRIYRRLRHFLPELALSALFGPMLAALESGTCHPLDALTGKAGQRTAGDWQHGLDQEWLADDEVQALAGKALAPSVQGELMERISQ